MSKEPGPAGGPHLPAHPDPPATVIAIRHVAKTILRDLWREAARLHSG